MEDGHYVERLGFWPVNHDEIRKLGDCPETDRQGGDFVAF
jgi:hypothetical protein